MFKLKIFDPSLKLLIVPVFIIAASLTFAVILFKVGYPQLVKRGEEIKESKKMENTLNERLSVLQEFKKGVLDDQSDMTFQLMPVRNPGAIMVSQMRAAASSAGVSIKSIDFSGIETYQKDIQRAWVIYQFEAPDLPTFINFLLGLRNLAPVSTLDTADITQIDTGVEAKIVTSLYWAPLPQKLPSLTEPLSDLTQEQKDTFKIGLNYKLPQYIDLSPSAEDQNRINPFN